MMLSTRSRYGIRALTALADHKVDALVKSQGQAQRGIDGSAVV